MRLIILVAALLVASCGSPRTRPTVEADNLKDQLVALEKQSWVAWQKRDGAFFASFLSSDHIEVGSSGPGDKTSVVAFVGSPACTVKSYAVDSFQLSRPTSDTALLVYHAQQKTTCGGVAVPSPVWVSSLYVFRDGRWQNALYQQSPANK